MAPPKGSRRGPSNLSTVSTVSPAIPPTRANKSNKPIKIVKLQLSSSTLSKFADPEPPAKSTNSKSSTSSGPKSSSSVSTGSTLKNKSGSEGATSLQKENDDAPSPDQLTTLGNEKAIKAGTKREAENGGSEDNKPKQKGPQRKRPKVGENGRLDGRTAAAKAAGFIASQHKLGPKANQGAINEKLRALDRTLKPCRKWHRTGFKIKSFTGLVWEAPSWNSQQTRFFGSDGGSQGTSNDMSKDENSSNIGSDNSPAGAPLDAASSPALVAAA